MVSTGSGTFVGFLRALRMFLFTEALLFGAPGFFGGPFFASLANHRMCGAVVAGISKRKIA